MKRIIALMLAFLMLLLCACSDKGTDEETTTAAELTAESAVSTTVAASTENKNIITEWNSDLLPEDFPAPPNGTHDVIIESNQPNKSYASGYVSMQFTCPENEIYRFTNDFIKAGYTGGAKNIASPSTYYKAGFNGAWQNGKNYIRISASQYNENGELTVVVDITECADHFPLVLTNAFPKFNGFSKNSGLYTEYDENKNKIGNEFIGSLNAKSWTWDFGYENAFIGVTEAEVDEYINKLIEAEFAGKTATGTTDGCTVVSYDLIKETETCVYGVFIVYNQILKTLDILYTNDAMLYIGQ